MAYKFNNDEEAKQFLDSKKFMVYPGGGVVTRTTTLKNYPRNANHIQESVAILDGGRVFLCHGKDDKSPLISPEKVKLCDSFYVSKIFLFHFLFCFQKKN